MSTYIVVLDDSNENYISCSSDESKNFSQATLLATNRI